MHLSIEEIARDTGGIVVTPAEPDAVSTGVTWDSREVKPGDLFVALVGARVDGHDFAASACESGAVAVLASRELGQEVLDKLHRASCAVVQVADTAQALVDLARSWRGYLDGAVIGITGSSGKTTTKNLVRDVLASAMDVTATRANQNNQIGVPRTLLDADEHADAVVVEMGMRGLGQIRELCEFVRPDMGLITNVGTSHLELLGSRENIALAKGELFDALPAGGIAFVNADDEFTSFLLNELQLDDRGVRTVFYDGSGEASHAGELGIWQNADPFVWATDISFDTQGRARFTLNARHFAEMGLPAVDGSAPCALELRGAHNVVNACAAAAVGLALGMTPQQCCAALAKAQPEQGRQAVLQAPGGFTVVDDAYNANPDSMRASLSMVSTMAVSGRRIAVLGDMGELGSFTEEGHRLVGTAAAGAGLDALVCVGRTAHLIAEAAREAGLPADAIVEVETAHDACDLVPGMLNPGDAVLVKASHAMELNRVVEELMG